MQLKHSFTVPATVDAVWPTLIDLESVAQCFPGAMLTSADDESFEGVVEVKIGPIKLAYKGSGRFLERDPERHQAVLEARGRDRRGNGSARVLATLTMAPAGTDSTEVVVVTELNITGKPAQFGRGVMQDVSDKLLSQFAERLEGRLFQADQERLAQVGTNRLSQPPVVSQEMFSESAMPAADVLDVGGALLPVIARRYGLRALGGVLGLVLLAVFVKSGWRRVDSGRAAVCRIPA